MHSTDNPTSGPCPTCGRSIGWDGHGYAPCSAPAVIVRRGEGPNARVRAASLYAAWRADGVPAWITSHEAHRLTGGKVGTFGDHSGSHGLNLSTVARRIEGAR